MANAMIAIQALVYDRRPGCGSAKLPAMPCLRTSWTCHLCLPINYPAKHKESFSACVQPLLYSFDVLV